MGLPAFRRLTDRILAHAGEDAVLRSETVDPVRKVNLEHGVELVGVYGDTVVIKTVATISLLDAPKVGDTLAIDGKNYVLDVLLSDNGYSAKFVVRDA